MLEFIRLLIALWMLSAPTPASAKQYQCPGVYEWTPKAYAEQFVEKQLTNPRSSRFSRVWDTREVEIEYCVFVVAGWVESTNGFGATVRNDYAVKLSYSPTRKEWEALEIVVE